MSRYATRQSTKRARSLQEEDSKENVASSANLPLVKKRRVEREQPVLSEQPIVRAPAPAPAAPGSPNPFLAAPTNAVPIMTIPKSLNPYMTLPEPTEDYVQLRFQLDGYKGVYRAVQVPLNYTFANLHTLVQYLFGWSGKGSHKMRVYTNVELYKSSSREGSIRKKGEAPKCPDELYDTRHLFKEQYSDAAIYEVVPLGKNIGGSSNYSYHFKLEDPELELSEIWDEDEDRNLNNGKSGNETIGIIYNYNDAWFVHITVDNLLTRKTPHSEPFVRVARGAPPVENVNLRSPDHPQCSQKAVSNMLFDELNFLRYCGKKIGSRILHDRLSIYIRKPPNWTEEQAKAKLEQLQMDGISMRAKWEKSEKDYRMQVSAEREVQRLQRVDREEEQAGYKDALMNLVASVVMFTAVASAALIQARRRR